jgi:TolB protein
VYTSPCSENQETYLSSGLFVVDADGSNMQALPIQGIGNYDPAWSPDGKEIAFTSLRETDRPQIWVTNVETGEAQDLSEDDNRDFQPTWSPDGSEIIFITTRNGPYQIWRMDPDGADQTRFSVSGELKNTHPVLSPNGNLLVFTQSEGAGTIPRLKGVFYPDGATQEFYLYTLRAGLPMRDADFSPDGFWVVFESWPDGEMHDIFIMSPNGAELTQLTMDPAVDFDPTWRPLAP